MFDLRKETYQLPTKKDDLTQRLSAIHEEKEEIQKVNSVLSNVDASMRVGVALNLSMCR
jgi:hypothetical protein